MEYTDCGDMNTFNMQHGYSEALVRGYKSGFLTENEYRHISQCETLEGIYFSDLRIMFIDVKLNLQETDYGNFLADEVGLINKILCFHRLVQFNLVLFANVL